MIPILLEVNNLFSHKQSVIDLDKMNLALFFGNTGSGKSSLFDAWCWIVYGITARKKYKTVLRNSPDKPKSGFGIFEFITDDKDNCRIERHIGKNKKLLLWVNGVSEKFRTPTLIQEKIIKLFGCDFKTFLNTAYFSQGDIGKFLSTESGERIKIVTNMMDVLSDIDKINSMVEKDIKLNLYNVESLKGQLIAFQEIVLSVNIKDLKNQNKISKSAFNKVTEDIVYVSQSLVNIKDKIKLSDDLRFLELNYKNIKENSKDILRTLKDRITDNIKLLKGVGVKQKKYEILINNLSNYESVKNEFSKLESKISKMESENIKYKTLNSSLENDYNSLDNVCKLKGSHCPTCKAIITDKNVHNISNVMANIKHDMESNVSFIGTNVSKLKKLDSDKLKLYKKIEKMNKLIIEKNELSSELKRIKGTKEKIEQLEIEYDGKKDKLKSQLRKIQLEIEKNKSDLVYLEQYNENDLSKYQNEYDKLNGMIDVLSDKIKDDENKIKNYYIYVKKITAVNKELDKYSKDYDVSMFWKMSLPKIKVDIIAGIIPFLEMETNKYLSQILPGKIIKFVADSSKVNNKLDVIIYDYENDVERIYEGWSGGEKDKMSISVYLALNKLASIKSKKTIDFLILDEKFSALDSESRMILLEMLKAEYENRKLFVISHTNDIISEFDQIVEVKKQDGISIVNIKGC